MGHLAFLVGKISSKLNDIIPHFSPKFNRRREKAAHFPGKRAKNVRPDLGRTQDHWRKISADAPVEDAEDDEKIDQLSPDAGIPSRMDDDGKLLDWCLEAIAEGFHLEVICARQ